MNKIQIPLEELTDIRKKFDFGFGEIIIYEPTNEMVEQYYEFIESINNTIDITGIDLVRVLIPLFTNIEITEDFLEENMHKLVDEPPLWLRKIHEEISVIVNELSVLKVMSLKNTIGQITVLDSLSEEDIKKYKNINLKSVKSKIDMISDEKSDEIKKLEKRLEELRS